MGEFSSEVLNVRIEEIDWFVHSVVAPSFNRHNNKSVSSPSNKTNNANARDKKAEW
jgi:hypothetical protein